MFGNQKKALAEAVIKAAEKIAPMVLDSMSFYCSRVLYTQASHWLQALAVQIDEVAQDSVEEGDQERAQLFARFCAELKAKLDPHRSELKQQMFQFVQNAAEDYPGLGGVLLEAVEGTVKINATVDGVITKQLNDIVLAASYLTGISPRRFEELTGSPVVTTF